MSKINVKNQSKGIGNFKKNNSNIPYACVLCTSFAFFVFNLNYNKK